MLCRLFIVVLFRLLVAFNVYIIYQYYLCLKSKAHRPWYVTDPGNRYKIDISTPIMRVIIKMLNSFWETILSTERY